MLLQLSLGVAILAVGSPVFAQITPEQRAVLDEYASIRVFLDGSCKNLSAARTEVRKAGSLQLTANVADNKGCVSGPPDLAMGTMKTALALIPWAKLGPAGSASGVAVKSGADRLDKYLNQTCISPLSAAQKKFQEEVKLVDDMKKTLDEAVETFRKDSWPQVESRLSVLAATPKGGNEFEVARLAAKNSTIPPHGFCKAQFVDAP